MVITPSPVDIFQKLLLPEKKDQLNFKYEILSLLGPLGKTSLFSSLLGLLKFYKI